MQCEICEKGIEKGKRIKLEGSVVVACEECSRYGEVVAEAQPPKPKPKVVEKRAEVGERPKVDERPEFILYIQEELVEGYPELIKNRRESLDMKQEELAKRINEPSSVVHRIESNRFEPSPKIAKKIQSVLGIKLMERVEPGEMEAQTSKIPDELTLGDLVVVKKRKKE